MAEINLETKNLLSVAEAKRRVSVGFEQLKDAYIDKIGSAEVVWEGDTAHFQVQALAQKVTAQVVVTEDNLSLHIKLPWLLAGFAPLIESIITQKAIATIPIAKDDGQAQ